MQNKPKISVIMATFNEPKQFIEASITSILNQTFRDLELLIADDSTNEETILAINDIAAKDTRVKIIRKGCRMGFVKALNTALKEAKGNFIARMDGDDVALLDRFEKQISFFANHPKIDVLGGAMNIQNNKSIITSIRHYPAGGIKLLFWMSLRDPIGHPTVMFRRKIIDNGIYYDETMDKGCEDTEFWLRLRNNGYRIANLQDPLVNYRITVDMALKREKDNVSNLIARKKNFSNKYFLFDCLSLVSMKLRMIIPKSVVSWLYSRENSQKY